MNYKILPSTVERLLYITLLIVFTGMLLGLGFLTRSNQKLSGQNDFLIQQIKSTQIETAAAREANKARQDRIIGYIKCIALLGKSAHPITEQSTYTEVATALDKCAMENAGA